MASFHQVFGSEPVCKYARSYCEYEGDIEVICAKITHGHLFCAKGSCYEPKIPSVDPSSCGCRFVKVYYHSSGPLRLSYECRNPACGSCGRETDPVLCALCDKREEVRDEKTDPDHHV